MEKFLYEPKEDTFLLNKVVQKYFIEKKLNNKSICEVGVGSGFILKNSLEKFKKNFFYASDINPYAISNLKKNKIEAKIGNLLEPFKKKKIDLIFFNAPYLPMENKETFESLSFENRAIYGGLKGYETSLEFLNQVLNFLKFDGVCFLLVSTLTKPQVLEKHMRNLSLNFKIETQEKLFFEKLIVYKITKPKFFLDIEKLNFEKIEKFEMGRHSKILQAEKKLKKYLIKIGKPQHIQKEIFFLKKLKDEIFSPKVIFENSNFLVYEKIVGVRICDFLKTSTKNSTIKVLNFALKISQRLDELKIEKFEMKKPYKHFLVGWNFSIKLIDYERSIFKENPKNTRCLLEYFKYLKKTLEGKNIFICEKKILKTSLKLKKEKIKIKLNMLLV